MGIDPLQTSPTDNNPFFEVCCTRSLCCEVYCDAEERICESIIGRGLRDKYLTDGEGHVCHGKFPTYRTKGHGMNDQDRSTNIDCQLTDDGSTDDGVCGSQARGDDKR